MTSATSQYCIKQEPVKSVDTLERRYRFAFVLIEGLVDNTAIFETDIGIVGVSLVGKCVLHPILVVALGIIFASMRTTRLLASGSSGDSLDSTLQNIT